MRCSMPPPRKITALLTLAMAVLAAAMPAVALDREHREKAEKTLKRGIQYLRSAQNEDGSWTPQPGPAVTALAAAGMLRSPEIDLDDPTVSRALEYILSRQQTNGGLYDRVLANYNTSISLMALGQVRNATPEYARAVRRAQAFLRDLQSAGGDDPNGETINERHPWYGGAGYGGGEGRPDLSNTAAMVAGLHDSGLVCTDPAYQRAITFITRLQGTEANEKYGDRIQPDGGFIYATSHDKDSIGELESKAGYLKPPDRDGPNNSRLRTYGSMTYAGFMSYLYASLDRDDPRVRDAMNWIRRNYTLAENPRMGRQGYYYYLHTFARALAAWGDPVIESADGERHEWSNELIDKLTELQREDGSWNNPEDRWMEDDPNLCTAYALLALQHALR